METALMTQPKKPAYAGVGSRQTPEDIQKLMYAAANSLEKVGLKLRSGGADGADTAFENGVWHWPNKEIILPWSGFNKRSIRQPGCYVIEFDYLEAAREIASKYHPAWQSMPRNIQELHTRNVAQVLGRKLDDPALFVLCWTPEGKGAGGTGQAIRIARGYNIPVFDMGAMSINEIEAGIGAILERI